MDKKKVLSNGFECYELGFGTWRLGDGSETTERVLKAIDIGYRKFDCAYSYGNDFFVGRAIKNCGIPREDLHITNKVWNDFVTREQVVECCKKSLKLMKLEYFDLYLIHWPVDKSNPNWKRINFERWQGLEDLYNQGLVKAIGLSNFDKEQIESLISMDIEIMPMINQIEFHPGYMQNEIVEYCNENNIVIEAYSPLGSGNVFRNEKLLSMTDKYKKSVAQLCLKWGVQHGVIPLPRAEDEIKMKENIDIFDFEIVSEDMQIIDNISDIEGDLFKGVNKAAE